MPQINLEVSEEQRERWHNAVEQHPEADSLSHLIRTSVERELSDEYVTVPSIVENAVGSSDGGGKSGDPHPEVLEALRQISGQLDDVTVRLDALEKEQRATTASEGVELQTEVFDALPTPPSGVETPIGEALTGAEPDVTEWGATVENLSDDLDTPEEAVRDALDGLKETTSQVEGRYTDDGTYHFKRE